MRILLGLVIFLAFSSAMAKDHTKKKHPATRSESVQANIPNGMYVRSDDPPCGIPTTLASLGKDPKTVAAVGKTFGPKAAAVVILVNQADQVASTSGGDGAGLWNKATGKRDGASCAAMCVRLPRGARPKSVTLSNRHGAKGLEKAFVDGNMVVTETIGDFSGWKDVVSTKANGRWLVCGTGTNWSGDQSAVMRMAVTY